MLGVEKISAHLVSSYELKIFKGENWELTFQKSEGVDVLKSGDLYHSWKTEYVDVGLRIVSPDREQKKQFNVKLGLDGKEYDYDWNSDLSQYDQMLSFADEIVAGTRSINDIRDIIETYQKIWQGKQ